MLIAHGKREEVHSRKQDQIACDFTLIGVETATEPIRNSHLCNAASNPFVLFVNSRMVELFLRHNAQYRGVIED